MPTKVTVCNDLANDLAMTTKINLPQTRFRLPGQCSHQSITPTTEYNLVSLDKNQIKPAGILKLGYAGFNLPVQNKLICVQVARSMFTSKCNPNTK